MIEKKSIVDAVVPVDKHWTNRKRRYVRQHLLHQVRPVGKLGAHEGDPLISHPSIDLADRVRIVKVRVYGEGDRTYGGVIDKRAGKPDEVGEIRKVAVQPVDLALAGRAPLGLA